MTTFLPSLRHTWALWSCVKHLNPRQGITTPGREVGSGEHYGPVCETPKSPPGDYNLFRIASAGVAPDPRRCETPKSPPGDYNFLSPPPCGGGTCPTRVKHLNPRQGITTSRTYRDMIRRYSLRGAKHLNPRQGITTAQEGVWTPSATSKKCETPKSPPGDYNRMKTRPSSAW